MKRHFRKSIIFIFCLIFPAGSFYGHAETLYNGRPVSWQRPAGAKLQSAGDSSFLLVRKPGLSPAALKEELLSAGYEPVAFIPPETWLVYSLPGDVGKSLQDTSPMEWMALPPGLKIDSDLAEAAWRIPAEEDLPLVVFYRGEAETVRQSVWQSGGAVTSEPFSAGKGRLGVQVSGGQAESFLENLASRPEVYTIEPGSGAALLNDNASRIVQNGSSDNMSRPLWDQGLFGQGQVVAVLDTGVDWDSCFFRESGLSAPPLAFGPLDMGSPDPTRRKIIVYDLLYAADYGAGAMDFDDHGHGTSVSGNALGSDINDPTGRDALNGIAPLAQLVVQDGGYTTDDCADLPALGCPVVDLTPHLDQAYAQGARIHNNSWGDRENFSPNNTYTAVTADMDDAVWRHPRMVICCAAGNSGGGGNQDSVGSPSVGKNVISLGATERNEDFLAGFSSRGWASDGRIKPDLTSPGLTYTADTDRDITTFNCDTHFIQGTSMASPVAAGCVALVRQYFEEGWYPAGNPVPAAAFDPSAALVKAVLIAGAVDMTGVFGSPPSRAEGWGRIHLDNSLYFEGDRRKLIAFDEQGSFTSGSDPAWETTIRLGGRAEAGVVRIVLTWTDYPADPAATTALVNDLDLRAESLLSGDIFYGNRIDDGFSGPGGPPDRLNNVEVIILPLNTRDVYRLTVQPWRITEGPQSFALAAGGDVMLSEPTSAGNWEEYR